MGFREKEPMYRERLLEIAAIQRQLLMLRYDRKTRIPVPLAEKRKGLFGREQVLPEAYLPLCQRLEEKRQEFAKLWEQDGRGQEPCWWKLPWEQIVPLLLYDLTLPEEEDEPDENGWRHAYELETIAEDHGVRTLCIRVRGHQQGKVSAKRRVSERIHSQYTAAERSAMEDAFVEKQTNRALAHMAFANQSPVYSMASERTYHTATEYYSSGEGIADFSNRISDYQESLYTVQETNHLSVSTESSDYRDLIAIGRYHVDGNGRLDYLESLEYSGDPQRSALLERKDMAVLCAQYLAEQEEVLQVPLELLTRQMEECAASLPEARRQAEMVTCLAGKLERIGSM